MNNKFTYVRILLGLLMLFSSSGAWAYFSGATSTDGVELKDGPNVTANTIKVLPMGTALNAADKPTHGYYRVRTATDAGWIEVGSIKRKGSSAKSTYGRKHRSESTTAGTSNQFAVKVLGDIDFISPSGISSAINSTSFNTAVSFGGEFMYFFRPEWGVGLRVENLSKTVTGINKNGDALSFGLSSTPIMIGTEYALYKNGQFYIHPKGFLGLAPTSFSATDKSLAGVSGKYSATPFTLLLDVEGGYEFSSLFSVLGEVGYRALNASSATLTGTTPLYATSSTSITSLPIKLSSLVLGLGVKFSF